MTEYKLSNKVANKQFNKEKGFVLTIELILIITILVIGSFVGIAAIRDALLMQKVKQQDRSIIIADSNNKVLGEVINFDEHDAPQLFYIDRTATDTDKNYRALIGVRDDRFTSREPIYYTALNCKGDPCIKPTSNETLDSSGVSRLPNTGAVSYFQALQGAPNYAIGRSTNGIPGFLFKETLAACPMPELIGGIGSPIGSRYVSQKVVAGEPCESPVNLPLDVGQPPLTCSSSDLLSGLGIPLNTSCDSGCGTDDNGLCGCPAGYYEVTGGILDSLGLTGQCCPTGTEFESSGLLGTGVNALCKGLNLKKAQSVANINEPDENALAQFTPPFQVNLPALGGRADSDQWYRTDANGEGQ